jgi:hypothetical protein
MPRKDPKRKSMSIPVQLWNKLEPLAEDRFQTVPVLVVSLVLEALERPSRTATVQATDTEEPVTGSEVDEFTNNNNSENGNTKYMGEDGLIHDRAEEEE